MRALNWGVPLVNHSNTVNWATLKLFLKESGSWMLSEHQAASRHRALEADPRPCSQSRCPMADRRNYRKPRYWMIFIPSTDRRTRGKIALRPAVAVTCLEVIKMPSQI